MKIQDCIKDLIWTQIILACLLNLDKHHIERGFSLVVLQAYICVHNTFSDQCEDLQFWE